MILRLLIDAIGDLNKASPLFELKRNGKILIASQQLVSSYDTGTANELLLPSGDYELVIHQNQNHPVSPFDFTLRDLSQGKTIDIGSVVSGTLDAGRVSVFEFNATETQRLFFNEQSERTPGAIWRLVGPLGDVIFNAPFMDREDIVIATTGTHTLIIDSYNYDSLDAPYSFQILDVPQGTIDAIDLDAVISGEISIPGETDRFSFELDTSTLVTFDTPQTLFTDPEFAWTIKGPGVNLTRSFRPYNFSSGETARNRRTSGTGFVRAYN